MMPLLMGLGGGLLKSLFKSPKSPVQQAVQKDDARDAALRNDELLKRRGGAADMVTGAYGVAAPAGGKTTLGS